MLYQQNANHRDRGTMWMRREFHGLTDPTFDDYQSSFCWFRSRSIHSISAGIAWAFTPFNYEE